VGLWIKLIQGAGFNPFPEIFFQKDSLEKAFIPLCLDHSSRQFESKSRAMVNCPQVKSCSSLKSRNLTPLLSVLRVERNSKELRGILKCRLPRHYRLPKSLAC
jgi:hypothetical protein